MTLDGDDPAVAEYAKAIDLIHGVRRASLQHEAHGMRHWALPASKVSADFICTAEHPKHGHFFMLADATGHGLASAIFALHTPTLFRESVLQGMSLPAIYERIHRFLLSQKLSGYFVCGIMVHVLGREIEVVNAGMPDALLLAADGRLAEAFASQHMPFGIEVGDGSEMHIVPQRYRLLRDETAFLLMYSDGLTELGILRGAVFGSEGVLTAATAGADRLFDRLVAHVERCRDVVHDDISIAMISLPLLNAPEEPVELPAVASQAVNIVDVLRIVDNFDRGLMLTDAGQRILFVNPAFTAITGYTVAEAVGQTPRLLNSGRHDDDFYRKMQQVLQEHGAWSGEIWNRRKDGTLYLEWLDIRTLHDEAGNVENFLAVFTVLKQQQQQEERLNFLALHDSLTGLANRTLLADCGEQCIYRADRSGRLLAVLFIDLDRFRSINDSLGYDLGDEVLVIVAQRLSAALRKEDVLARFAGNEFVCLLPDIGDHDAVSLMADKLLAALAVPIEVAGHQLGISASIGISAYPSDGREFDDLVVRADWAMLRAKQAGGNMVRFFCPEMAVTAQRGQADGLIYRKTAES